MTEVNRFSWEKITQVFSVVMLLDRDLRILKGSDVLLGHIPEVAGDRVLPDLFRGPHASSLRLAKWPRFHA